MNSDMTIFCDHVKFISRFQQLCYDTFLIDKAIFSFNYIMYCFSMIFIMNK